MLNVRDVFWSPDGNSIAFIGGSDIYIVDTNEVRRDGHPALRVMYENVIFISANH
jgi:hypothetical protein